MKHWPALESLLAPAAVPCIWRLRLGEDYESFSSAFLRRTDARVRFYPCPRNCGCSHEIVSFGTDDLVGVCCCEERSCDDLRVSQEELVVWELSWSRLAEALCRALGLNRNIVELGLPRTYQIGSWSSAAVPVILTIQHSSPIFRATMAALTARLRGPFVLLAPTGRHVDAALLELLSGAGAAFFALESHIRLSPSGELFSTMPPGELLARFTPAGPKPVEEDVARRAFALVQQLDSDQPLKPPTVLTVFRLYCIEVMSAAQIARRCGSSKATVIRRLEQIQRRTGLDPQNLRRVSPHLEKVQDELRDSRASCIHPRRLIEDDFDANEE